METTDANQSRSQDAESTTHGSVKASSFGTVRSAATLLSLPTELLEFIVDYLLPTIQPDRHVFPQPAVDSLTWERSEAQTSHVDDLYALLRTCKRLHAVSAPKLCYAPFLQSPAATNQFVQTACRNDAHQLIPDSTDLAQEIRALHLTGVTAKFGDPFDSQWFCGCEAHTLLSLAPRISYLSIHSFLDYDFHDSGRYDYDDEIGDAVWGHPFNHILSATTKSRPQALRVSLGGLTKYLTLSNAETFAPLSKLTHLDLIRIVPPKDLIAFLVGDTNLPGIWHIEDDDFRSLHMINDDQLSSQVVHDVAAGLSPHQDLECLRLAKLPSDALHQFGEFIAFRKQRRANSRLPEWEQLEADFQLGLPSGSDEKLFLQNALYELAVHSHRMPKLRLLIIDLDGDALDPPKDALSKLVQQGLLQDVSAQTLSKKARDKSSSPSYGYANEAVSSSFVPDVDVPSGIFRTSGIPSELEKELKQSNSPWLHGVARKDKHWQLTQKGKKDLVKLWNASLNRLATDAGNVQRTEIRVTVSTSDKRVHVPEFREDLHGQSNTSRQSRRGGVRPDNTGVWADPDVFSLVEASPWLSYFFFPRRGCCCWTGELPRDTNPNQYTTDSQDERRRLVYPALIVIPKSDDKPQAKGKRKSGRIQAQMEQEAEKKRQRAESNAADQAGPSSRPT